MTMISFVTLIIFPMVDFFRKEMKQDFSKLDSPACQKALRKWQIWSEGTFASQNGGTILLVSCGED